MPGDGSNSETILDVVDYEFTCTDGPDAQWRVYRLHLEESLNRPFEMTLDLVTPDVDTDTALLLGGAADILFERKNTDKPQCIYGIITEVEYIGSFHDELMVRIRVRPAFELARQNINSRIFQEMSVQDVVSEVLNEFLGSYGRTFDFGSCSRGTRARDYCVQYCESDFDFVCRLLEEEGITYRFEHDPDVEHEVMKMTDENAQYEPTVNSDGSAMFAIITDNPGLADVESLQAFDWKLSLQQTSSQRQDFDFTMPMSLVMADLEGDPDSKGRQRRAYRHMRRRYIEDEVDERKLDDLEAASQRRELVRGRSIATAFRPGRTFELERHSIAELETSYVITRVVHVAHCPDALTGDHGMGGGRGAHGARYENRYECVPLSSVVRPRHLTPKPVVRGPETGTVAGSEEIVTDKFGRIKVQFHWQEDSTYGDEASCWVPIAQSWASTNWGAQFIPRKGMEVVVAFLEGNPDRPLVTGCVYNGDNAPPFDVPGSKTQSGWRTNSSPGGDGFNELMFEDAAGSEKIYTHAQKDQETMVLNDRTTTICNNDKLWIKANRTKNVDVNQDETVGADKSITVKGTHTETIHGTKTQTVIGNVVIVEQSNETITLAGNQTETVGGSITQTVAVAKVVTIGAAASETVGAAKAVTVGASYSESTGGSRSMSVGGGLTISSGGAGSMACGGALGVTADKNIDMGAKGEMSVTSDKDMKVTAKGCYSLETKKSAKLQAKKEMVLKVGKASITLKDNGDIIINGKKLTVKGSGDVIVKGANIKLN